VTSHYGDNRPVDVIELSPHMLFIGILKDTKVLGTLCIEDRGNFAYKVLAIASSYAESKGVTQFYNS